MTADQPIGVAGPSGVGRDRVAAVVVVDGTGPSGALAQDEIVISDRIIVARDDYGGGWSLPHRQSIIWLGV